MIKKEIMFGNKKDNEFRHFKINIPPPPPPPQEVVKVYNMLKQCEHWINKGDEELVKKHWQMISDECLKYSK